MNNILVGYDGTPEAADALALARSLAALNGCGVVAAYAYPFDPALEAKQAGKWGTLLQDDAERLVGELPEGPGPDVEVERRVIPAASAARALEHLAEDMEVDLVVVGSSHRGTVGRILLGSLGESLMRGAPAGVAVAPRGFASHGAFDPRVIVVGYDGSPESDLALSTAEKLALEARATLRVVSIVEAHGFAGLGVGYGYAELISLIDERHRELLDAAVERLDPAVRAEAVLRHGEPASVLVAEAELGADLIIVGSRGHGPIRRALAGSVATKLLRLAPVPVVVTPRGVERTLAGPAATFESRKVPAATT